MKKETINQNWLFSRFGEEDRAVRVNLPHDAMILEPRDPQLENGTASGFYPGGKYVYTRRFHGREAQTHILEFEGIYMDSHVFLNGKEVGGRIYGYSNFFVDISSVVKRGQENELKVLVDNSRQPNSRWYSGSGIYRSVNLWLGDERCIPPEGLRVKTVSCDPAVIEVSVHATGAVDVEVLDGDTVVARASGQTAQLIVPNARLWSAEGPNLYTLRATLRDGERVLDTAETRFGIRTLTWSAENGLQVNGTTVKLRGGCIHHDHGILGAASYDKAEYRRIRKLKEFGYNAIRYAHNPIGKNLLAICDELGMYVMEESFDQWKVPQTACDYAHSFDREWKKDIASMVSKDYNHPCVILYCAGNEITDVSLPSGGETCQEICDYIRQLDSSRPTTLAVNTFLASIVAEQAKRGVTDFFGSQQVNEIVTLIPKIMANSTPETIEEIVGECADCVDIMGYNYSQWLYEGTHAIKPHRVMLSSETYPQNMAANWATVERNPYVIGDFQWTAWDYLGESGVGLPVYGTTQAPFSKPYPCRTAAVGCFDLTGFPETAAYYTAILWGASEKAYMAVRPVTHSGEPYTLGQWRLTDSIPCWTWPGCEGRTAQVEVYSRGKNAVLSLNGNVVGKKELTDCKAVFDVPYQPGCLRAKILDASQVVVAEVSLETAGAERRLAVLPEETEIKTGEIVFVPIHLTDGKGNLCMTENVKVSVQVEGGKLIALGSGFPETEESYQGSSFTSWHGRVLAVVKAGSGDTVVIRASSSQASGEASVNIRNKKSLW